MVTSFAIRNDRLFAATYTKILYSDDNGKTWEKVVEDAGWPERSRYRLAVFNDRLYCLVESSNADKSYLGLYKVNEQSKNLEKISALDDRPYISINVCGGKLFVNKSVSSDGITWKELTGGQISRNTAAYGHAFDGKYYYVGVYDHPDLDHIYRSEDGESYSRFSRGLRANTTVVQDLIARNDTVFAIGDLIIEEERVDSMVLYFTTSQMDHWKEIGIIPGRGNYSHAVSDYGIIIGSNANFGAPTIHHYDISPPPPLKETDDQYTYPPFGGSLAAMAPQKHIAPSAASDARITVGEKALWVHSRHAGDFSVAILNAQGKTIASHNGFSSAGGSMQVQTGILAPGVYFGNLYTKGIRIGAIRFAVK